jgi:hypothetical protein
MRVMGGVGMELIKVVNLVENHIGYEAFGADG